MFNKRKIFIRDFFTCQTCHAPDSYLHIAHKIKQGKGSEQFIKGWLATKGYDWSEKKIRDDIINHPYNVCTVCSPSCNDAQNIFFNTVAMENLLTDIIDDIINPF
jgi:hypothetical protein